MTRFLKSEAGAVVVWVISCVILAALLTPWLYGWGKDFARLHEDSGGLLGSLAGSCERAKISRYFSRSLMLSAVMLFWPLWLRLRMVANQRKTSPPALVPGIRWQAGILHYIVGFCVAGGILWLMGMLVETTGTFMPVKKEIPMVDVIRKTMVPAMGASVVEEWLFRALLLGLWLRISRPWAACVGTSLVFAFVHFLEPPHGSEIADPSAWNSGIVLLGRILQNYLSPTFLTADVLTLFVVGMSLAWARLKTASLWLPIGMHAGWIFAFQAFNTLHRKGADGTLPPIMVGETLRSGLLPLLALGFTWWAMAMILKRLPSGEKPAVVLAPQTLGTQPP